MNYDASYLVIDLILWFGVYPLTLVLLLFAYKALYQYRKRRKAERDSMEARARMEEQYRKIVESYNIDK